MNNVNYPDNLEDKVKDWLIKEGFPAWVKHKENHKWADSEIEHLVVQFILDRLDLLGERCDDNPYMFMGKTIKTLFEVEALHISDIITKCAKFISYEDSEITSYKKQNLGIELGDIYAQISLDSPEYFISKRLSDYLIKMSSMSAIYMEDLTPHRKYSLKELFQRIENIIEKDPKRYYDKYKNDSFCKLTILTDKTELKELFQVRAIEKDSLKVHVAKHLFTEQNVMTKRLSNNRKYIFEDHIKGTADNISEDSLKQILNDTQYNYSFSTGIKDPILNPRNTNYRRTEIRYAIRY